MRLKKYCTTEALHNERVLTEDEYNGFKVIHADDMVSIEDIIIPPNFANSHTNPRKVRKAIRFYMEHGYFDKPISVIPELNEQGKPNKLVLIDGLSRCLAAIELEVDILPAKYIDIDNIGYNILN